MMKSAVVVHESRQDALGIYPPTVGFSDVWDRVHWIIDILLKSISQISLNVIDEEWKLLHDHPWMNLRQYSMGEKKSNNAFKGFDRKARH